MSFPLLQCKGGDSKELSLGVTIKSGDNAVWHCFRGKCGWASSVKSRYPVRSTSQFGGSYSPSTKSRETALQKKRFPATKLPRPEDFLELDEEQLAFFKNRKISEGTVTRNGVKKQRSYCPQLQKEADALAFPYVRRGELVNVKYRGPEKAFWQVRDEPGCCLVENESALHKKVYISWFLWQGIEKLRVRPLKLRLKKGCGKWSKDRKLQSNP